MFFILYFKYLDLNTIILNYNIYSNNFILPYMCPSKEISIHLLPFNELAAFKEFIQNHWKENHIFSIENSIFDWQHKGQKNYNYMIAKQRHKIVGIHGIIPLNHFDKDLPSNQIFIALWRVLEGIGIGIGLRIFKKILDHYNPEFIAGLPVNPNVAKFYQSQKFDIVNLDHFVFLSSTITNFDIATIPKDFAPSFTPIKQSIQFEKLTADRLISLNSNHLYKHQMPTKSDHYIINRYMNHPAYDYSVYGIFYNSQIKCIFVLRPVYRGSAKAYTIVDYIGPNSSFHYIQPAILDILENSETEFIDIYSYGILEQELLRAGFINRKTTNNLIIPGLFEPFVNKNLDISCAFKNSSNTNVRIFKGDSDADRPNQIKGNKS